MKGHKEALEIFERSNLSNAVLLMVGNGNEQFKKTFSIPYRFRLLIMNLIKNRRLIITSMCRKETVSAFKDADLFLFPSNVECSPIVLFESMAAKTPFLCTDVGNSAEIVRWSNGGLILPTTIDRKGYSHANIAESALVLKNLLKNIRKRDELQASGFNAWKRHFTWEIISRSYESLYLELIRNKNNVSIFQTPPSRRE